MGDLKSLPHPAADHLGGPLTFRFRQNLCMFQVAPRFGFFFLCLLKIEFGFLFRSLRCSEGAERFGLCHCVRGVFLKSFNDDLLPIVHSTSVKSSGV